MTAVDGVVAGERAVHPRRLHVIIPAGGAGTRLWPLSRKANPKFLLDLAGIGFSLLQQTLLRMQPLAASITIVTGSSHKSAVCAQVNELLEAGLLESSLEVNIVVEPSGRDSMPAIGLAAALLARDHGERALVGSFAADHAIESAEDFQDAVRSAVAAAEKGFVTTVGIEPKFASTAFGYIQPSTEVVSPGAYRVVRFVEKPAQEVASRYLKDGYLWNAGMFVMRVDVLLRHLASFSTSMVQGLEEMAAAWGPLDRCQDAGTQSGDSDRENPSRGEALGHWWPRMEKIAIDHAIAEPVADLGEVAVVRTAPSVGWSDVGDFDAIADLSNEDAGIPPLTIDSPRSVIRVGDHKQVVVIGLPDAVVIDTQDALLVTTRQNAQRVKEAVDGLNESGRAHFT